ncbi:MAG: SDR family NAD(P)-dependent oxidoreductase [Rhodospirillales bacterium]
MLPEGKVTVITGAAQGIGFACAKRFVADGGKVMLSDIEVEKGAAVAKSLAGGPGEAAFMACDVGDKAQVDALVAMAVEEWGRLDVMIANAAVVHPADILELEEDDFDRIVRVNLKGFFLANQAAARQMVAQEDGGAIINMSSVQAVITNANMLAYAICKGGVKQLMTAAALALAKQNIRVNAIGPGTILTEMAEKVLADPAVRHTAMARTPMGRAGDPAEIAAIAAFLASDEASYITGETINADGGRLSLNYTVPVDD